PAAPHEATELVLAGTAPPRRLFLQRAETVNVTFGLENLLDGRRTERADQLVFEVLDANVEAELLHVRACQVGSEPGAFQRPSEVLFLTRVAESGDGDVREVLQEAADRVRAAHRQYRDSLACEITASP